MSPGLGLVSRATGFCAALTVSLVLAWTSPAAAQCGGAQLCAPGAGDCTIAVDCTITLPASGIIGPPDLGARRLVINQNLTVIGPGGANITLNVGDFLLNNAIITLAGANMTADNLTILSAKNITVQGTASLIDVSAGLSAGLVDLEALGNAPDGNVSFLAGRIKANGNGTRNGF